MDEKIKSVKGIVTDLERDLREDDHPLFFWVIAPAVRRRVPTAFIGVRGGHGSRGEGRRVLRFTGSDGPEMRWRYGGVVGLSVGHRRPVIVVLRQPRSGCATTFGSILKNKGGDPIPSATRGTQDHFRKDPAPQEEKKKMMSLEVEEEEIGEGEGRINWRSTKKKERLEEEMDPRAMGFNSRKGGRRGGKPYI
ncbi:hypothetical protein BHE74_00023271 [Ensete ventricosum]|nr:hypothetical protein BHE74_00023271 [Ensete ventricosum]